MHARRALAFDGSAIVLIPIDVLVERLVRVDPTSNLLRSERERKRGACPQSLAGCVGEITDKSVELSPG